MTQLRSVLAAVLALVAVAGSAVAEERRTPASEAAACFARGGELYAAGRYEEALAEFERANELAPHPANLFNMARCEENLGRSGAALETYRRALEGTESAAERADIERRIAAILERPVRIFVTSEPSGAEILVDANEAPEPGTTPLALELSPGPHRLILTAEGHEIAVERVVVEAGDNPPVEVALVPTPDRERPRWPPEAFVQSCRRVDLDGLHAHLALSFPIIVPVVHLDRDLQLSAGVGIRAHLTIGHWIVGTRLNLHPYARQRSADAEAQATRYGLVNPILEAGYAWGLEVAVLKVTFGISSLTDWSAQEREGEEGTTIVTDHALHGVGSIGLEVYALRWLSLGMDGTVGLGGGVGTPGLDFYITVAANLIFHL